MLADAKVRPWSQPQSLLREDVDAALNIRCAHPVNRPRPEGAENCRDTVLLGAQQDIARQLHAAYPDELDEVTAAAMVGAMAGAIVGALLSLLHQAPDTVAEHPDEIRAHISRATAVARPFTG